MKAYLKDYLKERISALWLLLSCVPIFLLIFRFYELPLYAVAYPTVLCLVVILLFTIYDASKGWEKYQMQEELQAPPVEVSSKTEQERLEYFTIWTHQIKTPISSLRLHLENEDMPLSRQLLSDVLHIEEYVEMVTTFLRIGSADTDYVFSEVSLDAVLRSNIRRMRGDFILKKNQLEYAGAEETAITDEKWLSFVVGQVLSNALKYTEGGTIFITVEHPKKICIRDTGIGIAPSDLPRIGEMGYTGNNGRLYQNSSGLGLYLCKRICENLGHTLTISSEPSAGTTVTIDVDRKTFLAK